MVRSEDACHIFGIVALARLSSIDIEVCEHCGGQVKVIASIEDPKVIKLILKHLKQKAAAIQTVDPFTQPLERGPPDSSLFDPCTYGVK